MAGTVLFTIVFASFIVLRVLLHRFRVRTSQIRRDAEAEKPTHLTVPAQLSSLAIRLRAKLQQALPGCVICSDAPDEFKRLLDAHWAQQACEVAPMCVLRPRSVEELAPAAKIFKEELRRSI